MFGGRHAGGTDLRHGILGDALVDGVLGSGAGGQLDGSNDGKGGREDEGGQGGQESMSTTQWLARRHGVKGRRIMYVLFLKLQPRDVEENQWGVLNATEGLKWLLIV